jgi:hypothetical protein
METGVTVESAFTSTSLTCHFPEKRPPTRLGTLSRNELRGFSQNFRKFASHPTDLARWQITIDAVKNGESASANGAPPSQPAATPQVKRSKTT